MMIFGYGQPALVLSCLIFDPIRANNTVDPVLDGLSDVILLGFDSLEISYIPNHLDISGRQCFNLFDTEPTKGVVFIFCV